MIDTAIILDKSGIAFSETYGRLLFTKTCDILTEKNISKILTISQSGKKYDFLEEKYRGQIEFTACYNGNTGTLKPLSERLKTSKGIVLLDGDLIFDVKILSRCISSLNKHDCSLSISPERNFNENSLKISIKRGLLAKISRTMDNAEAQGEYIGLSVFRDSLVPFIASEIEKNIDNLLTDWSSFGYLFEGIKNIIPLHITRVVHFGWEKTQYSEKIDYNKSVVSPEMDRKQRLAAAVKSIDGFTAYFFTSRISIRVVDIISRYNVTPNQITTFSIFLGLLSAYFFANGDYGFVAAGGILLQICFIFDCVDGQLSRFKGLGSIFGAWYDIITDRLKEYIVYIGICAGYYRMHGDWQIWPLGLLAVFSVSLVHFDQFYRKMFQDWKLVNKQAEWAEGVSAIKNIKRNMREKGFVYWSKKIFGFPIGERFALITVFALLNQLKVMMFVVIAFALISTSARSFLDWFFYYKTKTAKLQ